MLVEIYPNMTVCRVRPKSCSDFFLQSPTFGSFTMHLNGVSIYWCYTYRRPNARQEFPIFDTILGPMVHFYEPNLFLSIQQKVFNNQLVLNCDFCQKFLHNMVPKQPQSGISGNTALNSTFLVFFSQTIPPPQTWKYLKKWLNICCFLTILEFIKPKNMKFGYFIALQVFSNI